MIRRIGKYEVRARIGRGGMGTVYRAHDPLLNRPVAIKMISEDIPVTEDLRARFYREAQACAQLSHPNIVTIFEMGEDDGRLYIVMELLEGEELRQLISERRRLAIEDKVALMRQVCDGLHYAHQQRVVHRDIKPGNIIVLRNGVAKIVDFGIAHVATLESGLTRAGSFMGTLRYTAPEQAGGRADFRSDMFSVGSVFYELLAYRPAFDAPDPMHLLDQLRSEEPPLLSELDPAIPPDLSTVIARALRKDPTERFADLEQMRLALENVQSRLASDAADVRRRLGTKLERAAYLQKRLAERLGGPASGASIPVVEDRARLDTLRAVESEVGAQTERLQQMLEKAEALSPRLERGLAHLGARRFGEAIADLEAVLAELPEHERARAALERARAGEEQARRRAHVIGRLGTARAAFERGAYRECLEILVEVGDEASRLDLGVELAGLRRAAEAAITAREVAQREELERQRARVEAELALLEEARGLALDIDAARRAPAPWQSAEDTAARGRVAFEAGTLEAAADAFDEAVTLYHRAEEAAREAIRQEDLRRQRAQAERAAQRMGQQQTAADALGAVRRAETLWTRAVAKARDGQAAVDQEAFVRASEAFDEATILFRRAGEAARDVQKREELEQKRGEADRARAASARAREAAQGVKARRRAPALWQTAESREVAAQEAASEQSYTRATQLFGEAAGLYAEGGRAADTVRREEQQRAVDAVDRAKQRRAESDTAGARTAAETLWGGGEAKLAEGEAAFSSGDFLVALERLDEAAELYRQATETAESVRRREEEEALGARDLARAHRDAAIGVDARGRAGAPWGDAEARFREAGDALSANAYTAARAAFSMAAELFSRAERDARGVAQREQLAREREQAEHGQSAMDSRRAEAEALEAARRAPGQWLAASERADAARRALTEARYRDASAAFEEAGVLFAEAEGTARDAIRGEEQARQPTTAESARESMATAKARAGEVDAARRSPDQWNAAEARAVEAHATLGRAEHERATAAFQEAAALYERAEARSRDVIRTDDLARQRQVAEHARDLMTRRRAMAEDAGAVALAADMWALACARAAEALAALERREYSEAGRAFTASTGLFRQAGEAARRATPPEPASPALPLPGPSAEDSTILAEPTSVTGGTGRPPDSPTVVIPVDRVGDETVAVAVPEDTVVIASSHSSTSIDASREAAPDVRPAAEPPQPARVPRRRLGRPVLAASAAVFVLVAVLTGWRLFWPSSPASPPGRVSAEQGRDAARAARTEAEQVAVAKNAGGMWDRGRRLETEAEQAFARRDYEGAARNSGLARSAYQDGKAAALTLRARAESAKDQAVAARKDAVDAKAGEHAKGALDDAIAKERDADALMKAQDFGAARQAFADATDKFRLATTQARAVPDRQFLIGRWRSHQMEHGRDVLIYWTIKDDGTTSYDYYVDGQKTDVPASKWTYASGFFQEQYEGAGSGRCPVRATGPDSFQIEIVEHGIKRNYTRVGPRSRS